MISGTESGRSASLQLAPENRKHKHWGGLKSRAPFINQDPCQQEVSRIKFTLEKVATGGWNVESGSRSSTTRGEIEAVLFLEGEGLVRLTGELFKPLGVSRFSRRPCGIRNDRFPRAAYFEYMALQWWTKRAWVFGVFSVACPFLSAELAEEDLGAYVRPGEDAAENLVHENAAGMDGKISRVGSFAKWKIHEDDSVKFSYPDHAAITLEVKTRDPVKVDGDRVSTVDTSFTRAYRLVAGGETLGVMMLQDAEWLDDGICLCGAIDYERYLVRQGNLYRFSFLEGGVLKKMQVLGGGKRLMMFEWTHSPIHQAVYRKIARSVELIGEGGFEEKECREIVLERYGKRDAIGWLDEGASLESVKEVLGDTTRSDENENRIWETVIEEDSYRRTERFSLPFIDGKLVRFDDSYFDSGWKDQVAIKGSVAWMVEQVDPSVRGDVFGQADDSEEKPSAALKEELLQLFFKHAADPELSALDFNGICRVLRVLVKDGLRDEKALEFVRERFAKSGGHYAAWVLHETGDAESIGLFVSKVREIYAEGTADPDETYGWSSDLHNLLSFIPKNDARYAPLLREGLTNVNDSIRESAYYFIGSDPFPAEETMEFVRAGLKDEAARVRRLAADYFDDHEVPDADRELLREISENEKDERTRDEMREALKSRKER